MSTLEATNAERHRVLLEKSNSNQLKLQTLNDSISRVKMDMTSIKRASERQTSGSVARADEIQAGVNIVGEGLKNVRADVRNIASNVMSAKNVAMQILSWYAYSNLLCVPTS